LIAYTHTVDRRRAHGFEPAMMYIPEAAPRIPDTRG
jgi:hypothetical protein